MYPIFKKNQILTIPNLLSLFRLLLIPAIVWLYCIKTDYNAATVVILISGATDIADGIIARKFNMISDFGKILDPIADKLTQMTLIICLSLKHPLMIILSILFFLKECVLGALGAVSIKRNNSVNSAKWHGKLNTIVIYAVLLLMILFPGLPETVINIMIAICIFSMGCSLALYATFFINLCKDGKAKIE